MTNPFAGRSFYTTFATALLAIAALFVADTSLARSERASVRRRAARLFARGQSLLANQRNEEAIRPLQDAVALERSNPGYQRALAEAQLAAGKISEAESTLSGLLAADPADGPANLVMGRVLVKSSRIDEAISYFHRAIFGRWRDNPEGNKLRVRFELIDLLAGRNSRAELLAELLPVADTPPAGLKAALRMGDLFLLAGSPVRAADVYHGVLRDSPENPDAYHGLGEAEFARANYRAAQRNFQTALRLDPDRTATRRRLDLCESLVQLDPTIRGVGPDERLRRSRELVRMAVAEATPCVASNPPPEWQALADEAAKALDTHRRADKDNAFSEENTELAERIWQLRKNRCPSPPSTDSALPLVLAKLAQ